MPPPDDPAPVTHNCPECGAPVSCGSTANRPTCWCAELPHVIPMPDCNTLCLCRTCLEKKIAGVLRDRQHTSSESDDA